MPPTQLPWLYLFLAGLFEVAWAISMKYSNGLTKPLPTALTFGFGFVSFYLLAVATAKLPIGTSYAIWTGVGAVGTALLGILLFSESAHWLRLASILLVLCGIVGLRLTAAS